MTDTDAELSPGTESEYSAIEAAVMETARGRWFLAEYARRNRTADTETLLEAIRSLEEKLEAREAAFLEMGSAARKDIGRAAERIRDVAWRLKRRHGVEDDARDLESLVTDLLATTQTGSGALKGLRHAAETLEEVASPRERFPIPATTRQDRPAEDAAPAIEPPAAESPHSVGDAPVPADPVIRTAPARERPRLPRSIDFSALSFEERMALVS